MKTFAISTVLLLSASTAFCDGGTATFNDYGKQPQIACPGQSKVDGDDYYVAAISDYSPLMGKHQCTYTQLQLDSDRKVWYVSKPCGQISNSADNTTALQRTTTLTNLTQATKVPVATHSSVVCASKSPTYPERSRSRSRSSTNAQNSALTTTAKMSHLVQALRYQQMISAQVLTTSK